MILFATVMELDIEFRPFSDEIGRVLDKFWANSGDFGRILPESAKTQCPVLPL
jgi:hypothetical protein